MKNSFELLIRKDIIQILDGDEKLGDETDETFRMPYLKGTDLCQLSDIFGLHQEYGASRWTYLDNLLRYLVDRERCDELLCYMFDLERFYQLEGLGDSEEVIKKHQEICRAAINKINAKLILGRHELQYVGGHFYITETGKQVQVESPKIQVINVPYIQGLSERCKDDFAAGNYDSVITKSRTIIEEVLIYIQILTAAGRKYDYTQRLILQKQNMNDEDFSYILSDKGVISAKKSRPLNFGNRRIAKAYRHFIKLIEDEVEEIKTENPNADDISA